MISNQKILTRSRARRTHSPSSTDTMRLPVAATRRAFSATLLSALAAIGRDGVITPLPIAWAADATSAVGSVDPVTAKVTSRCFLDVSIGNVNAGRIVIDLFGEVAPATTENFRQLCTGEKGFGYSGSSFYRIIDGVTIQGGNIASGDGGSSKDAANSGRSIYGPTFPHENYALSHSVEGLISMVNSGKGGSSKESDSRFLIQLVADGGWADGRYPAFGRVVQGMDVVRKVEAVDVKGTSNKPVTPVSITAAGEIPLSAGA